MSHPAISPTLSVFLLASLLLAVTPGPGVIYVVTRTLAGGRRAGLASVCGRASRYTACPRWLSGGAIEPEDGAVFRRLLAPVRRSHALAARAKPRAGRRIRGD